MRLLFVHQNFPGQYAHLARHYAALPGNEVAAVGETPNLLRRQGEVPGAKILGYDPPRIEGLGDTDAHLARALQRARAVASGAMKLRQSGYRPDIVLAHIGWGEPVFLKDVFPDTPLLAYCEFFYSAGLGGFDPHMPAVEDDFIRCRLWNAPFLMALDSADWGVSPTHWQRKQFPPYHRARISVIHDGIDTDLAKPAPAPPDEELITYTAPNLEPYRGFHSFMRAIPEIQRRRPRATIVIVGDDHVRYSPPPPEGTSYRSLMLAEMAGRIDLTRVHFIRSLPYAEYLALLRRSSAHVYLTVPFVLSWSLIEAMASGCLIVASRTPPVEEVVRDGETGLLVDHRDPVALAARVEEALQRQREMQPLRDAARRTAVEKFDLKRVCLPAQSRLIETLASGKTPD